MNLAEACKITLELAEGNVIQEEDMADERARQEQAIRMVAEILD